MKKTLILNINANENKILSYLESPDRKITNIKIFEKMLAQRKQILKYLKSDNYDEIYFASKDIQWQRFLMVIGLYFFFNGTKRKAIIDDKAVVRDFSRISFIFKDIPFFLIELLASFFLIIVYYIRIPLIKHSLRK